MFMNCWQPWEQNPIEQQDIVSSRKMLSCSHLVPQPQCCSPDHQQRRTDSVVINIVQVDTYFTCLGRSGVTRWRSLVNRCYWSINRAARCVFSSVFCLFYIVTSSLGFSVPLSVILVGVVHVSQENKETKGRGRGSKGWFKWLLPFSWSRKGLSPHLLSVSCKCRSLPLQPGLGW